MSINLTDANFDKVLHFETYTLERFANLRFVSLLDAATVVELGFDAPAKHQQYYPSLPPGTPNNWKSYKYAKFYTPSNESVIFGVPWIRQASITENDTAPYTITVWGADQQQIDSLRSMMVANGITSFVVERN